MRDKNYRNTKLEKALSSAIGSTYIPTIGRSVADVTHHCIADSLQVENDEVRPHEGLVSGLGAESVDGLHVIFEIEKSLKIKFNDQNIPQNYKSNEPTVLDIATKTYEILHQSNNFLNQPPCPN